MSRKFIFRPGIFLFSFFFIILFCNLGIWQLHRSHYKKNLLTTFQQRLTEAPKPFLQIANTINTNELQFQSVKLEGYYLNDLTMFVQNQFYQDQLGYEVLTPVKIDGQQKLLLIDRGWIPANKIHSIDKVLGKQPIVGYIKLINEYQFILGKNIMQPNSLPLILQKINIQDISQNTHRLFYPYILRLTTVQHAFIRHWIITTMTPERHMGYAIQWFTMAFVLLLAFLGFSFEKVKK